jgi:hypothetical protein
VIAADRRLPLPHTVVVVVVVEVLSRIPRPRPSSAARRIAFADAPYFLLYAKSWYYSQVPSARLLSSSQKIGGGGPSRVRDVGMAAEIAGRAYWPSFSTWLGLA